MDKLKIMDYWVHLQILLFCFIIGLGISLFLGARSYIKIALVILLLYIPIEIYYTYKLRHALVPIEATIPKITIPATIISQPDIELVKLGLNRQETQTITADGSLINLPGNTQSLSSLPLYTTVPSTVPSTVPNTASGTAPSNVSSNVFSNVSGNVSSIVSGNVSSIEKENVQENNYAIFQNPIPSPNSTSSNLSTHINKSNMVKSNETYSMDKPPFDGLDPKELLSRLNYIYYATSQPGKRVNYHDFKTHADILLDNDSSKLSTNDIRLQAYAKAFYPQLTANQIDTRDCLNEGSGKGSCFQSPQLFLNKKNNFNILDKGVNVDNANLIVREDFAMPSNLESITSRPLPLDINAPYGILDFPLDVVSNETLARSGKLDISMNTCRNCKLAVCSDDYCGLQNSLFM